MAQSLLNGIAQGLLLAVVGVAFSLVYATTRVFYIALGAIYTLAPYVLFATIQVGLPWFFGVACALVISAALGIATEEFVHWPLERRRAPSEVHFISSLGVFLVIGQIVVLIWGNDARTLVSNIDETFEASGLRATSSQLVGAGTAIAVLLGTLAWLWWSSVGLQFRALASNSQLLATLGRDIQNLRLTVFGLSAALAALIAIVTARDVGFDPNVGLHTVLIGVAATIVGGRSSFLGAAVAGFVLGMLRSQIVWFTSARWEDAATFLLLATFLLFAPGGLKSIVTGSARRVEDEE